MKKTNVYSEYLLKYTAYSLQSTASFNNGSLLSGVTPNGHLILILPLKSATVIVTWTIGLPDASLTVYVISSSNDWIVNFALIVLLYGEVDLATTT